MEAESEIKLSLRNVRFLGNPLRRHWGMDELGPNDFRATSDTHVIIMLPFDLLNKMENQMDNIDWKKISVADVNPAGPRCPIPVQNQNMLALRFHRFLFSRSDFIKFMNNGFLEFCLFARNMYWKDVPLFGVFFFMLSTCMQNAANCSVSGKNAASENVIHVTPHIPLYTALRTHLEKVEGKDYRRPKFMDHQINAKTCSGLLLNMLATISSVSVADTAAGAGVDIGHKTDDLTIALGHASHGSAKLGGTDMNTNRAFLARRGGEFYFYKSSPASEVLAIQSAVATSIREAAEGKGDAISHIIVASGLCAFGSEGQIMMGLDSGIRAKQHGPLLGVPIMARQMPVVRSACVNATSSTLSTNGIIASGEGHIGFRVFKPACTIEVEPAAAPAPAAGGPLPTPAPLPADVLDSSEKLVDTAKKDLGVAGDIDALANPRLINKHDSPDGDLRKQIRPLAADVAAHLGELAFLAWREKTVLPNSASIKSRAKAQLAGIGKLLIDIDGLSTPAKNKVQGYVDTFRATLSASRPGFLPFVEGP